METQSGDGMLGFHSYVDILIRKVQPSALRTGRTSPSRKFLGTDFCYGMKGTQGYWMRAKEFGHLEISKNLTGNGARNLASCGTVPQPTGPAVSEISTYPTHMNYFLQITNGWLLYKAVHSNSFFRTDKLAMIVQSRSLIFLVQTNYSGAVTSPKCSAHTPFTTTFKKFSCSSTEVKTPSRTRRQGTVRVPLCLHLAPCLRQIFCWVYF
jgi:hypothetical protein